MPPIRALPTPTGTRLVQGDAVLSEVRSSPGPTHGLFDLLAAAIAELAPGPRVLLLGFAGGGLVAPLRALGYGGPLEAVDTWGRGERIFRRHGAGWAGEVRWRRAEAVAWLRRSRRRFDLILEDLSIPAGGTVRKPEASRDPLPRLIARRLAPTGVAVTNLLPEPDGRWRPLAAAVAAPHRAVRVVSFDEYDNRVVIAGRRLTSARSLSRRLGGRLRRLDSELAGRCSVRSLALR